MPNDQLQPQPRPDPYVFISYARADRAAAEQVEAFLRAGGLHVFRDVNDIRAGEDWTRKIHEALGECERMVLLLSRASMPYHKEVHLEWIAFDLDRKPIVPLYIEKCDPLYRLRVYNYIDARDDLPAALPKLLAELRSEFALPEAMSAAERVNIVEGVETESRTLPEALRALLEALRDPAGNVVLSSEQAHAIRDHKPADLIAYRLGRIAEWSLPRYYLDKRFVNLTLIVDKGEQEAQRWHRAEDSRFNNLRDVLAQSKDDPALALLGAPGSGKSTLLRRLQLDHSAERLRDGAEPISFFVQLNGYRARANGERPDPSQWLGERWARLYPQLPPLDSFLHAGGALLLLDALNEMPHKDAADYHRLVALWRAFAQEAAGQGNHIVFSCRSLDYSASLSSPDLRVPQVEVQPMNAAQMQTFLQAYVPAHHDRIWNELDGSPRYGLFQTPYFLKLLCDQVEATGEAPAGRAALFTGFVRQALKREVNGELFQLQRGLLVESDHQKLSLSGKWRDAFELPERGPLIPTLGELAHAMQLRGIETEGAQVRLDYDDACKQIAHEPPEDILKAGLALNLLDHDLTQSEIAFFHQLLQEYFAARRLAKAPNPELLHVEWEAARACPTLAETLAGLADGDPLPPLPQTGWEETALTAAPMAKDPSAFIRALIPRNLPLAARCAASSEVKIGDDLKREIQQTLIERTRNASADLRARLAAGEALGLLGDPRFERRTGPHGDYLMPPLVAIPGGTYPMGDNKSDYDREKPAHKVKLEPFQIGRFPLTNAEYAKFIEAGGYDDPQWWDTEESRTWLSGEASTDGQKEGWRDHRKRVQGWSEDFIRGLVARNRITSKEADDWITVRNWTDEEFEQWLDETFPAGTLYRQPGYWEDARFNNPAQPVVGITWFEARAYCNWLTANAVGDAIYRLPTEAEFEAAARGPKGRMFPYGKTFDSARCNTFESHIRRTTPIGIFDNATPEGTYDLSGNAYTWTLSIYDEKQFPYPYRSDDGREDIHQTGVKRVLRGGSWSDNQVNARSVYRNFNRPAVRDFNFGCRVVCVVRPPSL